MNLPQSCKHATFNAPGEWLVVRLSTCHKLSWRGVCVCACTLIRPQDVNCNIPAHGRLAAPSGAQSLWESDEILGTWQPAARFPRLERLLCRRARATSHQRRPKPPNLNHSVPFPINPYHSYARPQSPQTMGPVPRRGAR